MNLVLVICFTSGEVVMRYETFLLPVLRAIAGRAWLSNALFARDRWGNPFAEEQTVDPFPAVRAMWDDGPVTYRRRYRQWFVVGYDECQIVLNHPAASAGERVDDMLEEVAPFNKLAPQTKSFFRSWMLLRDGTEHARLRRLVSRTFTPRRIAEWEPVVQRAVSELLDDMGDRKSVEIVSAFNRPLPVNVISAIVGIPPDRSEWIGEIVAATATFLDPFNSFDPATIDEAVSEFRTYILGLAEDRVANPQPDLLTALAEAEDEGDRLTEDELVANVGLLVFAGHDTTTHMLGNAMVALAANPAQRRLVREDPELWPNAVEELLRFDTSVATINREVSEVIDLNGTVLPAGSSVSLVLNGANRDPRRWDNPWELQLDRDDPRPLAFGHGRHHCLGHALARMELRIGLEAFVERFGDYTVDTTRAEWRKSVVLRGPVTLHVNR